MAAEVYGKLPVEEVSDIDAKDVGCAASRSAFALVSADVPRVVRSTPDEWVPRKAQRRMDTFIQYGMAAAAYAVKDAGWTPEDELSRLRTGVMIGSGIGGLPEIEKK